MTCPGWPQYNLPHTKIGKPILTSTQGPLQNSFTMTIIVFRIELYLQSPIIITLLCPSETMHKALSDQSAFVHCPLSTEKKKKNASYFFVCSTGWVSFLFSMSGHIPDTKQINMLHSQPGIQGIPIIKQQCACRKGNILND